MRVGLDPGPVGRGQPARVEPEVHRPHRQRRVDQELSAIGRDLGRRTERHPRRHSDPPETFLHDDRLLGARRRRAVGPAEAAQYGGDLLDHAKRALGLSPDRRVGDLSAPPGLVGGDHARVDEIGEVGQDPGLEPGIIRKRVGETLLDDAAQQVEHLAERVDVRGEIAVVARAVVLGQQPPQLAAARRCGSGRHGLAS